MPFAPSRLATLALCSCLLLAAALTVSLTQARPAGAATRIVNGAQVTPATFATRWSAIAALVERGERDARVAQFCGATFVSATEVVTAAHCVIDRTNVITFIENGRPTYYNFSVSVDPTKVQVLGGRRSLSGTDGARLDISHILIHPRYDARTSRFDVAVIVLKAPVAAGSGIGAMPPIEAENDALWGAGGGVAASPTAGPWIAGWGYRSLPDTSFPFTGANHQPVHRPKAPRFGTTPRNPHARAGRTAKLGAAARSGRSIANTLEEATVPIHSDAACDIGGAGEGIGYGRDFDASTMLCAGTLDTHDANDENATTNGIDSCYGDSGGPVMLGTPGGPRLVGIVSFGNGCATRDTYGVYTRVAAMRSFLAANHAKPVTNTRPPKVVGMPEIGSTLTCDRGTWGGAGPIRYSYRWARSVDNDGSNDEYGAFERLPGSYVGAKYLVRPRDRGARIRCIVIATGASSMRAAISRPAKVPGTPPGAASDDEESAPTQPDPTDFSLDTFGH
jgi:hypothetical protein